MPEAEGVGEGGYRTSESWFLFDDTIGRTVHRLIHGSIRGPVDRLVDHVHSFVCVPFICVPLTGESGQSTEHHHQGCEDHRSSSAHLHPFRCVPYRRDRSPGFDARVEISADARRTGPRR